MQKPGGCIRVVVLGIITRIVVVLHIAMTTRMASRRPTTNFIWNRVMSVLLDLFHKLPLRFQQRIISSVVSSYEGTPCWIWVSTKNRNGYGRTWWKKKRRVAHRAVYEALVQDIPEGLLLDHLCRVRDCVNPLHQEPVTPKVNTERGEAVLFRKKNS